MTNLPTLNDSNNAISRSGLQGTEIERTTTAATVLAERSREMVRARIMHAIARPRDMFLVRERILAECRRPEFAAIAWFRKPMGGSNYAEGFSIRFAESALRAMGNIAVSQAIVFEDSYSRTISVVATDLETNASTDMEIVVGKTVERKFVKTGQTVLGTRLNTYGEKVHILEATEDEFGVKAASAIAKARRQVILQLLPGDIQAEAKAQIKATRDQGEKAVDPAARRKALIDSFGSVGVKIAQLSSYLGGPVDAASNDEMRELHDILLAIQDKETTWSAVMATRESADENANEVKKDPGSGKRALSQVKAVPVASTAQVVVETAPAAPPHDPDTGEVTGDAPDLSFNARMVTNHIGKGNLDKARVWQAKNEAGGASDAENAYTRARLEAAEAAIDPNDY